MGVVHKAQSKTDDKWYAVKVLPRRSMWNVRLARRQVRAFGQFQHPTVVPFVDVGTSGGLHYLVWNFVDGETLESIAGQLRPEVEIVVIDGASTDDTPAVVDSFRNRIPNLVYIRRSQRGGIANHP